ncbi:hypothetical protein ASG22_20380 [Chryseobacterium sp. Leaf405]|uniref:hypothetical protein n=1 Tax=Chryseobacterium sp. Leaf405 TaxID=1736367 RepID=UPI0006F6EABB|nr:hypothetical protein [Chryseobacterium sp. Leaf405]KQT27015.1 hypothetical protein ASG22_20380 [Chryseobacterium sp. Leaf405]
MITQLLDCFIIIHFGINTSQPNSSLVVEGSYKGAYKEVTTNTALTNLDQYINITGTASVTLTLPDAITAYISDAFTGRVYHIKNTSSQNAILQGSGGQLLRTGNNVSSNTLVLRAGESISIVKNYNFNLSSSPLWDTFNHSISTNNNSSFVVGETKSFRTVIDAATFLNLSGTRGLMTGKAVTNVTSTNRRVAYELANAAQQNAFIVINGLRMNFMTSAVAAGNVSPKFFNITGSPITYNVAALSTNDAYITIAPNYYSIKIDGNDDLSASIDEAEYVNAMVTLQMETGITVHGMLQGMQQITISILRHKD